VKAKVFAVPTALLAALAVQQKTGNLFVQV